MGVLRALAGTLGRTLVKPWRIIGDADLDYSPTGRIWVGTLFLAVNPIHSLDHGEFQREFQRAKHGAQYAITTAGKGFV